MVNLFGALPAFQQQPAKQAHHHCQQDVGHIVLLFICRMHHYLLQVKVVGAVVDTHFWAGHNGTVSVTKQDKAGLCVLTA